MTIVRLRNAVLAGIAILAMAPAPVRSGIATAPGANPTLLGQPILGSPIRHVIVIVQENRSFDNLFAASIAHGGPYPGADTSQTAMVDGDPVRLEPVPFEYPADPSHSHLALLDEWDRGKMDGFATDYVRTVLGFPTPAAGFAYAYLPAFETTIYHVLAARYALADQYRAASGPDVSQPLYASDGAESHSRQPERRYLGLRLEARDDGSYLRERRSDDQTRKRLPCFDQPTIADLLDAGHVSWKYYTGPYKQSSIRPSTSMMLSEKFATALWSNDGGAGGASVGGEKGSG